jgi:predicted MFS family arabinose efflux permease
MSATRESRSPATRAAAPPRLAYGAVLAAALCCYAALGEVLSILPGYVPDELGGGPTAVGLAVGAPALTGLLARPLGGRLADRHGARPLVLAGAAAMAAGALPAVASATLGALLLSRLAVGAGEGVMMSATVLWLLKLAGPERRGRALGHIGLANFGGLAAGPLLAAVLGGGGASRELLALAVVLPLLGAATVLAVAAPRPAPGPSGRSTASTRSLLRLTAPAGLGLLLVNVGYVSVLAFGAHVARNRGTGLEALIVPVFAVAVIASRTLGAGLPDRLGGTRTVVLFAGAEALGLLVFSLASSTGTALAALLVLSIGQSLAVPGLGLLALARVPAARQGAAAGLFFAWFDAGVGLGGPAAGIVASLTSPSGALIAAAIAVAGAAALLIAAGARRRWAG